MLCLVQETLVLVYPMHEHHEDARAALMRVASATGPSDVVHQCMNTSRGHERDKHARVWTRLCCPYMVMTDAAEQTR